MEVTMSAIRRSALASAALVLALSGGAAAQQTPNPHRQVPTSSPCGARADVVKMLKENFGERAMAHGIAHSGTLAEVFISPGGTWTIIATSPNGISCMIGSGESWKTTLAADETT
jgi:hypothetical protein